MNQKQRSDLEATISQALEEMKEEQGSSFSIDKVNLAELGRRTGISRKRLRKIQKDGFVIKDHALKGTHHGSTVLTGYTALIDDMLRKNNRNSNNIMDILVAHGYSGGLTQVKEYVEQRLLTK